MRRAGRWLAVLISLLGHGGAMWLIARLRLPPRRAVVERATEMTLVRGAATLSAAVVVASSSRPKAKLRSRQPSRATAEPVGGRVAPTEAAPATTDEPPAPPPAVQLFPEAVIEQLAKVDRPAPGGTLRRRGDGQPPPDERGQSHQVDAETARRAQQMLHDATGATFAESGRVDPAWRDAERQIDAAFHPRADQVTRDSRAQMLLGQLGENEREPRTSRRADPTPGSAVGAIDRRNAATDQAIEQAAELHRRVNRPPQWTEAEIETVVDERGEVLSATVVSVSGNRAFDKEALAAVLHGLSRRRVRDPKGKMVARWVVQAGVSTFLPPGTVLQDLTGRAALGATLFSFTFDETTGKIGLHYPMQKSVSTRVRLRALTPQP